MLSRKPANHRLGVDRRRMVALLGSAMLAGPFVAACQPLYGTTPSGVALQDVMAGIEIKTIPGRVGQRVRNELIFATTRGGYPGEPRYQLNIIIKESFGSILVRQTGDARGQIFQLDAKFELFDKTKNAVVLKGKSAGRAAFDRFDPIFTNIRAQVDAENRAASMVADSIRTQVAAFLSGTA